MATEAHTHRPEAKSLGPCILFAVVKSAGWARQTDLGPGPSRPRRSRQVVAPLPFRTRREPEQLPVPLRPKTRGARIRKDGPRMAKEEALGPHDDEDDGVAFRRGGRLQGSPGHLPAMERTPRARRGRGGGLLRRRLRRNWDRGPDLSPAR